MKRLLMVSILVCIAHWAIAADDSLRCGGKIVRTGMKMDEVRKACGKPSSTEVEEHDVRAGNRVVGTTELNIWYYKRGSGQKTAMLEFDQDKLLSIKYVNQ